VRRTRAPLSVVGLELEYAIVDAQMRPACLVDVAFRALNGRPTSDVVRGPVGFSNELAAHVLEAKMMHPRADFARAEGEIVRGLGVLIGLLHRDFGARLLPTGMHPLMRPSDTTLWSRGGRSIYETYARVFDIRQHGWLNVQSCHVNLPYGKSERDLVSVYNAAACVLPYLPALAANSAIVEGRIGPHLDNRLAFYAKNQRRIPEITGDVVPEPITSTADYRARILGGIYGALAHHPGAARLRHEWVNSRGAILRFTRHALELRILDIQECVRMDVAIAVFARAAIRHVARELDSGGMALPEHGMLVRDFRRVVAEGRAAGVRARHLLRGRAGGRSAGDVLAALHEQCIADCTTAERPYLDLAAERLSRGSVSELVRRRVRPSRAGERVPAAKVREVYGELIAALEHNRPWQG
jgi:gamma-glutamyl:cysteine ligase YbdK (ATP-grasp superfamily)